MGTDDVLTARGDQRDVDHPHRAHGDAIPVSSHPEVIGGAGDAADGRA